MILFYIVSLIFSCFVVIKYATKSPLIVHFIVIVCYTLYNPFTNKIIFIILSLWGAKLFLTTNLFFRNKFVVLIFTVGTYWLFAGIIGAIKSSIEFEEIISGIVSPYFNGVLWAVIIISTLKGINDVRRFCYFYALMRVIEIGVLGLYLYFFQYELLLELRIVLDKFIRLDVDPTKRLISFASRNANEAAFLLVGAAGFLFHKLYLKINFKNGIVFGILVIALFLTWTRSGWLIFIILILLYFLFIGRVRKVFLATSLIITFLSIFPIILLLASRSDRVFSDESLQMRIDLYLQYISNLYKVPFFYGIYNDIWVTADKLSISMYITSENTFIDTFVKFGILAGILYSIIWTVFLYLYGKILIYAKRNRNVLGVDDFYFIVSLCATFFATFVMVNTSLFEQMSFCWLLFGLSIPVYKEIKSRISNSVTM